MFNLNILYMCKSGDSYSVVVIDLCLVCMLFIVYFVMKHKTYRKHKSLRVSGCLMTKIVKNSMPGTATVFFYLFNCVVPI